MMCWERCSTKTQRCSFASLVVLALQRELEVSKQSHLIEFNNEGVTVSRQYKDIIQLTII